MMKLINQIQEAKAYLVAGSILAYPTEAVYGLGCDPFNERAVIRLLALKQRTIEKGLILLIANWQQLDALIAPLASTLLEPVKTTWPGPVTWLFPKADTIPYWLSGAHDSIAIRMTNHPIASQLCQDGPIVSTSANKSGLPPATTLDALCEQFPEGIDAFMRGELGGAKSPSKIYDVQSGRQLR